MAPFRSAASEQGPNQGLVMRQPMVSSMIRRWTTKSPAVPSLVVLSFAFLVSFGFFTKAQAICTNQCQIGWLVCFNWCQDHNKTVSSRLKCSAKCDAYWNSGKNPQSIGRSDPSNPPPKTGPVQVENPPTTVGPPARGPRPVEPLKPVKPVGVSNPNKTNGGPVILLREHNDSGGQGHGH
jgi:hypothetical protein